MPLRAGIGMPPYGKFGSTEFYSTLKGRVKTVTGCPPFC